MREVWRVVERSVRRWRVVGGGRCGEEREGRRKGASEGRAKS